MPNQFSVMRCHSFCGYVLLGLWPTAIAPMTYGLYVLLRLLRLWPTAIRPVCMTLACMYYMAYCY